MGRQEAVKDFDQVERRYHQRGKLKRHENRVDALGRNKKPTKTMKE